LRRIALLIFIVCGMYGTGMCQYAAVFSSYHGNKRYDFPITREQLAKTPAWLEDQPNPPLPPRRAVIVAFAYLGTLFADAGEWRLGTIALIPVRDRWVYSIEFTEPRRSGCADCFSSPFRVLVMMDGTAVSAPISP